MTSKAADLLKDVEFKRGPDQHTFTAIGRCPRTGRLGVAVTTASSSAWRMTYSSSSRAKR